MVIETMLTEGKAGMQALGDRLVEVARDTRRYHGCYATPSGFGNLGLKLQVAGLLGLSLKTQGRILGNTWRHLRVSVEAK